MRAKKRCTQLLALLLIISILAVGCAKPTETPETTEPGAGTSETSSPVSVTTDKTLRINLNSGYPDIIDPQKSSFMAEIAHLIMMYQGLTAFDSEGNVIPGAAERWEMNDDATEWTFYIRENLKYSDGSLLNAKRFEYAILRNINPETAGEYGYITDEINGAEAWRYGETDEEIAQGQETVMQSVVALRTDGTVCESYDDPEGLVLKLTFSRPVPYFGSVAALWVTFPVKEEIITEKGEDWWIDAANHIGNGPFYMAEMEPQVRTTFKPNAYYHGEMAKVNLEYSYITESAVVFQAYQNDEFDIISVAAEDLATILNDDVLSEEYLQYAGSCTFGFIFNSSKEPFDDPKVRQAFAMALDREAYSRDVLSGLGIASLTWIPAGLPGSVEDETRWGYDPEAARQALAESSYGSAENLPTIVDTYSDTARNRLRHEWLAAAWKEVLGVDVELNPVEPTTYSALTKDIETAPQLFLLGWCADYPDPQTWISAYWKTGAQAWNMVGYSNAEVDEKIAMADTSLDQDVRIQLYQEAQDLIIADCPAAFMYHTTQAFLVKPWVTGIEPFAMDVLWPGSYEPTSVDIDTSLLPQ